MGNNNNDIVLQECPKTFVYWNQAGNICITQPSSTGDDMFVHFPVESAAKIIKALQEKIKGVENV